VERYSRAHHDEVQKGLIEGASMKDIHNIGALTKNVTRDFKKKL